MIRTVKFDDIDQICNIYNYYVENTIITFEEKPVTYQEMEIRIKDITASFPWYVYEEKGKIIGYTYAGKWKERCAYRYTVESTVYLENNCIGKGIGSCLYKALLDDLKEREIHAVVGVIALPNEKSQKIHETFGFKKVAQFEEVGYKFNKWIDVESWELLLNKR